MSHGGGSVGEARSPARPNPLGVIAGPLVDRFMNLTRRLFSESREEVRAKEKAFKNERGKRSDK
jgi:hypothetical protein